MIEKVRVILGEGGVGLTILVLIDLFPENLVLFSEGLDLLLALVELLIHVGELELGGLEEEPDGLEFKYLAKSALLGGNFVPVSSKGSQN